MPRVTEQLTMSTRMSQTILSLASFGPRWTCIHLNWSQGPESWSDFVVYNAVSELGLYTSCQYQASPSEVKGEPTTFKSLSFTWRQ